MAGSVQRVTGVVTDSYDSPSAYRMMRVTMAVCVRVPLIAVTVAVYVPASEAGGAEPPPLHPVADTSKRPTAAKSSEQAMRASSLRRRPGRTRTINAPKNATANWIEVSRCSNACEAVATDSTEVEVVPPVIVRLAGLKEHVANAGSPEQLRFTFPAKPAGAVTEKL